MLISPTEPAAFKRIGKVSPIPERHGVDFLIVGRGKKIGVQRKKFPEDLLASLSDNRLYEQLQKMSKLDAAVFVIEGFGRWSLDGNLVGQNFTKDQMYGLFMSLAFVHRCQVFQVRDMNETIGLLEHIERWGAKKSHTSLVTRGGKSTKNSWGMEMGDDAVKKQVGMRFLQSFNAIGPVLAERIYDFFGGVPVKWDLEGIEKLMEVPGIGKAKAESIWRVLEEGL